MGEEDAVDGEFFGEFGAGFVEAFRRGIRGELATGVGGFGIPVFIEGGGDFGDDGAGGEDVEVPEVVFFAEAEVFVADIATADNGEAVIGDEHFVVHAAIEFAEVEDEIEESGHGALAEVDGVEEFDVDVGVMGECGHVFVFAGEDEIIDEEADADAAICGGDEACDEEAAGFVILPNEVLGVDGAGGVIGEGEAGEEGLFVVFEEVEAGFVGGMGCAELAACGGEKAGGGGFEGGDFRLGAGIFEAGAGGEGGGEKREGEDA